MKRGLLLSFLAFILLTCEKGSESKIVLYRSVPAAESGIDFANNITISNELNFFNFGYIYSGAGVAVGDINNDGLQDVFFAGNMVGNKLYLNEGSLKFQDITQGAGILINDQWNSGVAMSDVNGDGFLDIYVSVSGTKDMKRENLLYINNGDLTFTESANERGVSDNGHSTQSTFFDYDRDGDLDLYVANYPPAGFQNPHAYYREKMDNVSEEDTDRLFENDGTGYFKDVTRQAKLFSYGLSLSATVGDFNQDGWPDLYVSNDFSTPDYFYFNNGDGTFREAIKETTRHISFYGMGVDVGDINNDGLLDIVQAEMNPADNFRSKANMASMNPPLFWGAVSLGFHYQYMQNSLQLNQGIRSNGLPFFSDISRKAGMASTDWSWATLFMDMNNDGWKDVFISNGIRRDINNKDFFKLITKQSFLSRFKDYIELSEAIPSEKVPNYAFKNINGLEYEDASVDWGLAFKGFSNGAAYSDLDNDGDLDLLVNNVDTIASIFENRASNDTDNDFLRFKLKGPDHNHFGIGTKVELQHRGEVQFQELTLTRGYQSSVEPIIHFGAGQKETIDEVIITWPDGLQQRLSDVSTNQVVLVDYKDARIPDTTFSKSLEPYFNEIEEDIGLSYVHVENEYDDFKKEPLLPHKMSQFGPWVAVGDVNNDGLEDFYIGAAAGFKGQLFTQQEGGAFTVLSGPWEMDKESEDLGALFFDANSDGNLDLYVVSGGNEFERESPFLQDRLYLNTNGTFHKIGDALPTMRSSGSCVTPLDYDGDGDKDLFVGGRLDPAHYPLPGRSYLLENISENGKIQFVDVTKQKGPALEEPGMVTSAVATDFDSDGDEDLVVVGEWMPISFFENRAGEFVNVSEKYGLSNTTGWWFSIIADDFDADGDEDLVVGNLGLNYKYQASEEETFDIYAYDYDDNDKLDIVLSYFNEGTQYPVRGRECSSQQIPALANKFKSYTSFAKATLSDVYTPGALEAAVHYQASIFSSVYMENLGNRKMKINSLPDEAQLSNINDMVSGDFNQDGLLDFLAVGNLYVSEVETPRNDASYGLLLAGNGKGDFVAVDYEKSGIYIPNDARAALSLKRGNQNLVLIANNNGPLQIFSINQ